VLLNFQYASVTCESNPIKIIAPVENSSWNPLRSVRFLSFLNFFVLALALQGSGFMAEYAVMFFSDANKDNADALILLHQLLFLLVGVGLVPFLPALPFRRTLRIGLGLFFLGSLYLPLFPHNFLLAKAGYACIGAGFGLIYIITYQAMGSVTHSRRAHASAVLLIEAGYMLGAFVGLGLYGYFLQRDFELKIPHWVTVGLAGLLLLQSLFTRPLEDREQVEAFEAKRLGRNFMERSRLFAANSLVLLFVVSIYLIVFVRTHFEKWIHIFDKEILELDSVIDLEITAIVMLSMGLGRLFYAFIIQRMHPVLVFSLNTLAIMGLIIYTEYYVRLGVPSDFMLGGVPTGSLLLPLTAFFIGPLMPILYSTLLSHVGRSSQSAVIGFILIATILARWLMPGISEGLYESFTERIAYYFALIPLGLSFVFFFMFFFDLRQK